MTCETVGKKIRSEGRGQGLGTGDGAGPLKRGRKWDVELESLEDVTRDYDIELIIEGSD